MDSSLVLETEAPVAGSSIQGMQGTCSELDDDSDDWDDLIELDSCRLAGILGALMESKLKAGMATWGHRAAVGTTSAAAAKLTRLLFDRVECVLHFRGSSLLSFADSIVFSSIEDSEPNRTFFRRSGDNECFGKAADCSASSMTTL